MSGSDTLASKGRGRSFELGMSLQLNTSSLQIEETLKVLASEAHGLLHVIMRMHPLGQNVDLTTSQQLDHFVTRVSLCECIVELHEIDAGNQRF